MLGVSSGARMVLVTMGGTPISWLPQGELGGLADVVYVVPTSGEALEVCDNVVRVPLLSNIYHPDLVHAADVVVTKLGYSTVAEAYGAGVPVGYVARSQFRESVVLERFIRERGSAVEIDGASFLTHAWAGELCKLLDAPRRRPSKMDGAHEVASFVVQNIFST
jgi:hypothetical protein